MGVCGRQQKTLENYTRAIVGVPPVLCGGRMYGVKGMMGTSAEDHLSGCVFYVRCNAPNPASSPVKVS